MRADVVAILNNGEYFEGITSWTTDLKWSKNFKHLINPYTSFATIFQHKPLDQEAVLNVCELWKSVDFVADVNNLNKLQPKIAYPLLNFKDTQSEVILKSTLKSSEIISIIGISNDFDKLCDQLGVDPKEREKLSKDYAKNPNAILINEPSWLSKKGARNAVKKQWKNLKKVSLIGKYHLRLLRLIFTPTI